jgi:cell division protein FtsB
LWVRPLILKRIIISLVATLLGLIIGYTGYTLRANQLRLRLELHQTQQQKQELDNKLQQKSRETDELKKLNDDLQIQLQAKKQQQAILASATRRVTVVEAPRIVPNCGDNQYAQFIYQHESGCNLNAVNSLGCRGIGQACPGSKLPCGADYACQNAFFTNYTVSRYGSWYNAYQAWLIQHWW